MCFGTRETNCLNYSLCFESNIEKYYHNFFPFICFAVSSMTMNFQAMDSQQCQKEVRDKTCYIL